MCAYIVLNTCWKALWNTCSTILSGPGARSSATWIAIKAATKRGESHAR